MDTFSMVVILLIAAIAYAQGIWWLFIGMLLLFILTIGSLPLILVTLAGFGFLYFFDLKQHWFIFLVILLGLTIIISERKKPAGASEEYYSPELMQLLGGGGGGGYGG